MFGTSSYCGAGGAMPMLMLICAYAGTAKVPAASDMDSNRLRRALVWFMVRSFCWGAVHMFAPCAGLFRAPAHTANETPCTLAVSMRAGAQSPQGERRGGVLMGEGLHRVFTAILPDAGQGIRQRRTMTAATFESVQIQRRHS